MRAGGATISRWAPKQSARPACLGRLRNLGKLNGYFFHRNSVMGNVQSIERAIEALPPAELAEFRSWFAEFDAAAWDAQIEQDAAAGKLDQLASEALAEYESGSAREL